MTRIRARGEQAVAYDGLPCQDQLLWEVGVLLAPFLACAFLADLLTRW